MDIFDEAVAKGLMNIQYARACLSAQKREITQSPLLSVREGMRNSGAGRKVLKWLIASGITNNIEFLKNEPFADSLMEYLVAEELQEAAWLWIQRAFRDLPRYSELVTPNERMEARRDIVRPLMLLVKAEASGPVGLDAAYMVMFRAAAYLEGMSLTQKRHALGPPGCYLSHESTRHSRHRPASPSSFDTFLELIPAISRDADYHMAHLSLYHPSRPSAALALAFLRRTHSVLPTDPLTSHKHHRASREYGLINLGLDTAKFLLERDQFADADWVMDYLRSNYPRQLGMEQRRQLQQAEAEASSLQLLEGLSLA